VGGSVLAGQEGDELAERRAAVEKISGKYTGMFGQDYLRSLRKDWPE
jgi:hypothetical protein